MMGTFGHKLLQAILLLLVQGMVLNHVNILGYATPMPYLYFLLTFQKGAGRKTLLCAGFLLGVVADLFTNTPGIAAASCTLMGMIQPVLLSVLSPRDSAENLYPSYASMGFSSFAWYLFFATIIFQLVYYLLAIFSLAHPADVFYNIVGGTFLTWVLMLGFASFHRKKA